MTHRIRLGRARGGGRECIGEDGLGGRDGPHKYRPCAPPALTCFQRRPPIIHLAAPSLAPCCRHTHSLGPFTHLSGLVTSAQQRAFRDPISPDDSRLTWIQINCLPTYGTVGGNVPVSGGVALRLKRIANLQLSCLSCFVLFWIGCLQLKFVIFNLIAQIIALIANTHGLRLADQ